VFCRSTSVLDVAAPCCIRASIHRDRSAARRIYLFAECDTVELVQHGFVEAFADAVGLRALGFGARVIDVLNREIEFVLVPLRIAAVLAAAVGQYAQQLDIVAIVERDYAIVKQISRRDRRLAIVELGAGDLSVGVDEGLLVDAPNPPSGCRHRTYPGRQAWLADVLARLPDHPAKKIDALPPWNWGQARQQSAVAA
jgi:hypothetical protein